ncbi:YqeG family HAD IIIA-type phosphatase [Xylocopilactobacillus apicola]|uniref:Haloacid dehalogenase n=1 Tax=Xylocopilactobacillus apicola TaxID=2932184 RepID=A0AAU9DSP8_9LACO|nr:YqeG family HAD IIIA-type phosphatase [Xylocopilactobacillus apicola]BDR58313.1 haloacid dehalogenase [Xylocopilactobacillus apicola]
MQRDLAKKWYYPTWKTSKITDLDPISLKAHGIKGVITDLDNTLVAWDLEDSDQTAKRWINSLKDASIPVIVVSNNNQERVEKAVADLGVPFVAFSLKPAPFGIRRALKQLNLKKQDVILVGDQVLTDLFAGLSSNIKTVLVDPLVQTDNWNTRINRFFERPFMKQIQRAKGLEWKIK